MSDYRYVSVITAMVAAVAILALSGCRGAAPSARPAEAPPGTAEAPAATGPTEEPPPSDPTTGAPATPPAPPGPETGDGAPSTPAGPAPPVSCSRANPNEVLIEPAIGESPVEGGVAYFELHSWRVLEEFTVSWATENGTATAGNDYTAARGTVTFTESGPSMTPGAGVSFVSVSPTAARIGIETHTDELTEVSETFYVRITGACGATYGQVGRSSRLEIHIVDDDSVHPLRDVILVAGERADGAAVFTLSRARCVDNPACPTNYRNHHPTVTEPGLGALEFECEVCVVLPEDQRWPTCYSSSYPSGRIMNPDNSNGGAGQCYNKDTCRFCDEYGPSEANRCDFAEDIESSNTACPVPMGCSTITSGFRAGQTVTTLRRETGYPVELSLVQPNSGGAYVPQE